MRSSALKFLACPHCGGGLVADAREHDSDGHILTGELRSSCGLRFPIARGVPRLTMIGAESVFSTESPHRCPPVWPAIPAADGAFEQRFLDRIDPITPRDFVDRVVLEAGCGNGEHTRQIAAYGAKAVVSMDCCDAVDVAFQATRHLEHVHIVEGDMARLPVGRKFDIALSVGSLHQLSVPYAGFRALYDRVIPGGRVAIWVLGYESNEWVSKYVDPIRRHMANNLTDGQLYWLTLPSALALAAALPFYRSKHMARKLPLGKYLAEMSRYSIRDVHRMLFSHVAEPVAHYLPEHQIRMWFAIDDLDGVEIVWHNEYSWRGFARVIGHKFSERAVRTRKQGRPVRRGLS